MTILESQQSEATGRRGIFYGWWLVLLAGLVVTAVSVPYFHSLAIWAIALEGQFMWSRAHLGAPLTISRAFTLLAPVTGYLTDRFGPRRLVLAGLCMAAAGFGIFGLIRDLPTFYAASIVIVIGAELCGSIPLVVMLSHWFVSRRATAIAIYLAIPALLALPLVPLITWGIDPEIAGLGWRPTAFIVAGVIVLVLVAAFFRICNKLGDIGLLPLRRANPAHQATAISSSLGQALRSRVFWYLAVADGFASASLAAGHTAANWRAEEIADPAVYALVVAIASFVSACFFLVGGVAGDRFPKYRVMASFAVVQAMGLMVMFFAGNMPAITFALVLMSIGTGGLVPLNLAILADYFGTGSLGSILGVRAIAVGLAAALAPASYVVGLLLDLTESNFVALLPALALTLAAAVLFLKSAPPQQHR